MTDSQRILWAARPTIFSMALVTLAATTGASAPEAPLHRPSAWASLAPRVVQGWTGASERVLNFPISWAKGMPYTALNPEYSSGGHGEWSCGQVAHAQILRYWQLQGRMQPTGSYWYPRVDTGEILLADFDVPLDWAQMEETICGLPETDPRVPPVADLARRFCIATRTVWPWAGGWERHKRYEEALAQYFGYDYLLMRRVRFGSYLASHSWSDLYAEINADLDKGCPMRLTLIGTGGAVHEVVIYGYRYVDGTPEYIINFGNCGQEDPSASCRIDQPIGGWDLVDDYGVTLGMDPVYSPSQRTVCHKLDEFGGTVYVDDGKTDIEWNGSGYAVAYPTGEAPGHGIRFLRLNAAGRPAASAVDVPIGGQWEPQPELTWTGSAYGMAWGDRVGGVDGIYFNMLSPTGQKLLPEDVYLGGGNAASRRNTDMTWNGAELAVARRVGTHIQVMRIAADGTPITGSNVDLGKAREPRIVWVGDSYRAFMGYGDSVWLWKLDELGRLMAPTLVTIPGQVKVYEPSIAYSGSELGVAWIARDAADLSTLYFCRANRDGEFITSSLTEVCSGWGKVRNSSLSFSNGEYLLTYRGRPGGTYDSYLTRISAAGAVLGTRWLHHGSLFTRHTMGGQHLAAVNLDTKTYGTEVNVEVESRLVPGYTASTWTDGEAPQVAGCTRVDDTHVDVEFSEKLRQAEASVSHNFNSDHGLTVVSASLDGNRTTAHLETSEQAPKTTYTLTVTNVKDLAGHTVDPAHDTGQWGEPWIDWAGTPGYSSDGVDPDTGKPKGEPGATRFRFAAKYTDPGGNEPSVRKCQVRYRTDNLGWKLYRSFSLTPGSGTPASGQVYARKTTLPPGVWQYRFRFATGAGVVSGSPSEWADGPAVDCPPMLSWSKAQGFDGSDGARPSSGYECDRFWYRVVYRHSGGVSPTTAICQIRLNETEIVKELKMEVSSNPAYADHRKGATYCGRVRLKKAGRYSYRFLFSDGTSFAVGAPRSWTWGPTVLAGTSGLGLTSVSAVTTATGAQVTFSLSAPASLNARVLNLAGRPVATLCTDVDCGAGTNTLLWNGRSRSGLTAPRGTYMLELVAAMPDGRRQRVISRLSMG